MEHLFMLLKQAQDSGLDHIYHSSGKDAKQAKTPRTPKATALKLTSQLGKKKPLYVAKKPTTSPYNPN